MARIRSIKPQFWTSEQIADCSPNARLLFIGLWNFCDDYGVHPASTARLKMEVFPSDPFTKNEISSMVDELLEVGLLKEYEVREEQYWIVPSWGKHQRPDTKTGQYPLPDGTVGKKIRRTQAVGSASDSGTFGESTPNVRRSSTDHSPTEEEEVKEQDKGNPVPSQVGEVSIRGVPTAGGAAQKTGNGGGDDF